MTQYVFRNQEQALPQHFYETELGSVADITTGCQYPAYNLPQENLQPFTVIEKISNNQLILSESKYIRVSERERVKYKLRNGDIVFIHRTSSQQLGRSVLFDLNKPVLHTKYLRIRPKDGCNSEFLLLMLNRLRSNGKLHQIASERENLSCIIIGDLKKIKIPFASVEEQKRIVSQAQNEWLQSEYSVI